MSEIYGFNKWSPISSPSKIMVDPGSGKNRLSRHDQIIGEGIIKANSKRKSFI